MTAAVPAQLVPPLGTRPPHAYSLDHLCKAQFGEDRVLWRLFSHRPFGYFIEVGAYNGVDLSNTYFLEQMGWCGVLVEPIRELCEHAAAHRPRSRVIHAACGRPGSASVAPFTVALGKPFLSFLSADDDHVARCRREGAELTTIEVPVATLDDILLHERQHAPAALAPWRPGRGWSIDLVSIDTEGCELDVLEGFNLDRFRPRVLVLENDRPAGQAIEPYLASQGYRKIHRRKINDFYVRADESTIAATIPGSESACA